MPIDSTAYEMEAREKNDLPNCSPSQSYLLVSGFEVACVTTTSFKLQSHVTFAHQIVSFHAQLLRDWHPARSLPLHNRSIWRKVHAHKLDFIVETVAFQSVQMREKKMFLFQLIDN